MKNRCEIFFDMPFGAERRKAIIEYLQKEEDGILVNAKWCPLIKGDPDLKKLLKNGTIYQTRVPRGGRCNGTMLLLREKNAKETKEGT